MYEFKGKKLYEFTNNYTLVDIETTGFSPIYNDIIEIGAIKVRDNIIIDEFQLLINPNVNISTEVTNLTGITNEMIINNGKDYNTALTEFYNFIENDILIAHNANFDINFLYKKCETYINEYLSNNYIDTLELSKSCIPTLSSYKLSSLAEYFDVSYEGAHRGLADVKITYEVYNKLKTYPLLPKETIEKTNRIFYSTTPEFTICNEYLNKKIAVKTTLKILNYDIITEISQKHNAKTYDVFYNFCNYLIINDNMFEKYQNIENHDMGKNFHKAKELEAKGKLIVLSESQFCESLNIPVPKVNSIKQKHVKAKDISTNNTEFNTNHPIYNKICVFTGTLEKYERKQAFQIICDLGGICKDNLTMDTDYLIVGNKELSLNIKSSKLKKAEALIAKGSNLKIYSEEEFYKTIL